MHPSNLLFICSDEHRRDASGCYGNPLVQTPHLDALAGRGVRFANAYTNCPICVPSRGSLATGRYVHDIRLWDNAFPYTGGHPAWGHRLQAQGYRVDSIGKLHYRRAEDDDGFDDKIDAMYVAEGIGELISCIRENPPLRKGRNGILSAGPGESSYLRYDARIAERACGWLADHAQDEKPWVLFTSFVNPHPPLLAPQELYDLYPVDEMPLPVDWQASDWPRHPALERMRRYFGWEEPFDAEAIRKATATYYAQCSYLDQKIGQVLSALDANGLADNTRIIYTSDHGAMMGAHGLWGKFTLYDDSCGVPLIVAGPDLPAGKVAQTPVSLVDCFPTILEAVGAEPHPDDADLPGESLWGIANGPQRERFVFSEYHAAGSLHAASMLCDGHTKFIHYHREPAHLFDLDNDPQERVNLADSPVHQPLRQRMESHLAGLVDVDAVDRLAKADQAAKLEEWGGEEAVLRRGLSNSSIPGEKPLFHRVKR